MNNWKGEPWSRRGSLIAAGLLVFMGVVNVLLRLTDTEAGTFTTALGLALGLWFCVLGWMYFAHAKFNVPRDSMGSDAAT